MVPSPLHEPLSEQGTKANGHAKVYVIDGLLDLTLSISDLGAFDVRFAACECLKAYFSDHAEVRAHFLSRAIDGYRSGSQETTNVLTVLLNPSAVLSASDPYRLWFAAVIAFHLLYDNPTAKLKAAELTEGDAESGEEVVTSIQTITAHLVAGLRRDDDPRILVGYLMLLLGWLYEDIDAVNDFLNEGSNVQSLIHAILQPIVSGGDIVQGLCTMLLGLAYEFSTKDSPIPRATLHQILLKRLERDRYIDRLSKLRSHPLIRDFEVIPQKGDAVEQGLLPEVFFDAVFVDFFKDNFSRISRGIDREPGLEISVITNGIQKGVSRELVDSLRDEVKEKDKALEESKVAMASLEQRLGQEQADHRRSKESVAQESSKAQEANAAKQREHEAELRKLQTQQAAKDAAFEKQTEQLRGQMNAKEADFRKQLAAKDAAFEKQAEQLKSQIAAKEADHKKQLADKASEADKAAARLQEQIKAKESELEERLKQAKKNAESEAERLQRRTDAETADLKATISRLEVDLMKVRRSAKDADSCNTKLTVNIGQ